MDIPLLETKLYIPPTRSELVSRPRLIERLNAGLGQSGLQNGLHFARKLTLVSAPAGFGKTTLVSEWVSHFRFPILDFETESIENQKSKIQNPKVAWLSLDEGDNDVIRFLTYLIAALQTIDSDIGQAVLVALRSPGAINIEAVLISLINEVADYLNTPTVPDSPHSRSEQSLVLVLDDYHVIESQPVDKALTFLLDHLPPRIHLVIATRTDPALGLSRLRARGQLTELRADDLRFSADEATTFLQRTVRLPISADHIRALEDRTEGWITGLQLAAVAMQSLKQQEQIASFVHDFGGSHRYVIDYLLDEIFERQTSQIQTFLLQTSILDRMAAPLCDAVCFGNAPPNQADSQAILEQLEAANLFLIPLDSERRWYRYHHLFADLLRYRLRRKQAGAIPELHRRASEWYEQNGFIARAIDHVMAINDMEQATRLIEGHYRSALQRGQVSIVLGWIESLPDAVVRSDPSLSVGYAWALFLSGQMDAIEVHLQDAETVLASQTTSGASEQVAELFGEIATLRAYLLRVQGEPVRAIELAKHVLEQVPGDNLSARGILHTILGGLFRDTGDIERASQSYAEAVSICQAGGNIMAAMMAVEHAVRLLVIQGQLVRAAEVCRQMVESNSRTDAQGKQQALVSDIVRASMGNVLYEWNELVDADAYVRKGIEQGKRGGFFQSVVFGQILLARVLQARGDGDGASNTLQEVVTNIRMNPPRWYQAELTACQVHLWLAQGNLAAASRWVQESELSADTEFNQLNEFEHIPLVWVLVAQGRAESNRTTLSKALELLDRLYHAAESAGRIGHMTELLILQAMAREAQGDINQALIYLERALAFAEPQGYVRTFVDKGKAMAQLLYQAAARGMMPDYTRKLLSAFGAGEQGGSISSPQPLVEPLSKRELEIMQLIAQGLSNREISERLFVALSTIKGHNQNIYGKLQVKRRTEAIIRARELGLV